VLAPRGYAGEARVLETRARRVKGSKTQVELSAIAGAVLLSTAKRTKAWYCAWRFTQQLVTRSRHARRLGWFWQAEWFVRPANVRRRLGNASLLNAMVGEIDDMNLDGIVIRRALARAGSDQATTATA